MKRAGFPAAPALAALALVVLTACSDRAGAPLGPVAASLSANATPERVTNNADTGPGSFRAAIAAANANPAIDSIRFRGKLPPIALLSPIVYTGSQSLTIVGVGVTVDGAGLAAGEGIFVANGGGNLSISEMEVMNAPGIGISVLVPGAATGTLSVTFDNVLVHDNGLHGVLINDQEDYLSDPDSPSQLGSAAGIQLRVVDGIYEDNGLTVVNQDGIRVNEGGDGHLDALITDARFQFNGGDGVELDERGAGDALFTVKRSSFGDNGGFDAASNPDDGFDVGEAGEGHVVGLLVRVQATTNAQEGFDISENDGGNMSVELNRVDATDNIDYGIAIEEDAGGDGSGTGDLYVHSVYGNVSANGSVGSEGLRVREYSDGNLRAVIADLIASSNGANGLIVRETGDGTLDATLVRVTTNSNVLSGMLIEENDAGDLWARVVSSTSTGNGWAGVWADQFDLGQGTLRVRALTGGGNGDTDIVSGGVTVIQTP